jgi:6-phosphogluconolactonase
LDKSIKIFTSPYELAEKFAEELVLIIGEKAKKERPYFVALSGGATPSLLFSVLGDHFSKSIPWEYVHFFWGDERCVIPENPESNYGTVRRKLFDKIIIPSFNIHRIKGEVDPDNEAVRYSKEISEFIPKRDGLPEFDMIILGLGVDGHTASIFSTNKELLNSEKVCEVTFHPVTKQKRITLTGRVINNADSVVFLVTGKSKACIVEKIINKRESESLSPASYIVPVYGVLRWFIDKEAGSLL